MNKPSSVAFSYRGEHVTTNAGLLSDKPNLFNKLRDRDLNPVITLNAEHAFTPAGVQSEELVEDTISTPIGEVAARDIGLIVNRLDRSFKKDELPSSWVEQMPPLVNENALRSLVFRKHLIQEEVLSPLGLGMPTKLIERDSDIDQFIAEFPSDEYVVKPTSGTFSKDIHRLSSRELTDFFKLNPSYGKFIAQPAFDFSLPLASDIKAYDSQSEEEFKVLSKSSITKELRMYGFHSPQETSVFPVARAIRNGQDKWFFVDPDSLPPKLEDDTKAVFGRAAALTGSRAIYGALDIAYGQLGSADPSYTIVEFNGRMPYMISREKHEGVADTLREKFADQIQQTITSGSDKIA